MLTYLIGVAVVIVILAGVAVWWAAARRARAKAAGQIRNLQDIAAFLDTLVASAPVGIAFLDRDLRYIRVNDALVAINQIPAADHIGRSYRSMLAPELTPTMEDLAARALAGETIQNVEISGRPHDRDEVRHWLGSYYPVRVHDQISGIGVIVVDVTEQRCAKEALEAADQAKNRFIAMLGHELRNPLSPIRNAISLWTPNLDDQDQLAYVRGIIDRQTAHMVRLVDDLLDVSRVASKRIILQKELTTLKAVLDRALEMAGHYFLERNQQLDVDQCAGTIELNGDPVRLAQVFSNLLHNASKFTDPGGHIALISSRCGDSVCVRVVDDGCGIAPDLLRDLFRPFLQADTSLDRSPGGLGVGLSIAKEIVELHGGTIVATSRGLGRGAEFIVSLPVYSGGSVTAAEPRHSFRPLDRRVLVVDDNVDSANSLALLLGRWGCATQVVYDGHTCLEAAAAFRPDAILLDIGLPGMSGYEVAARLRREQPETCLIAVTGYGQEDDRRRSRQAGFDHHLVKPVEDRALHGILASCRPLQTN